VKGKETESDTPLINIPAASFNNRLTFQKENWFGLTASLKSEYTFRQNEFPDNIMVFSPLQQEEVLLPINTPPEAYHLLHMNADITMPFLKQNELGIGVTINNITNNKYRNYLNRQRYFADEVGRNFLLRLTFNY